MLRLFECCVYIMHGKFSWSFPDYTVFICKFKTEVLFIHETFLVYKLETSRNCKEVKHIMILIIAIIYIFFIWCDISYIVVNYFQKILRPPGKIHTPRFTHFRLKIKKLQVPSPFRQNWKFLAPTPLCRRKGGGEEGVSKSIISRKPIYLSEFSYSNMGSVI